MFVEFEINCVVLILVYYTNCNDMVRPERAQWVEHMLYLMEVWVQSLVPGTAERSACNVGNDLKQC